MNLKEAIERVQRLSHKADALADMLDSFALVDADGCTWSCLSGDAYHACCREAWRLHGQLVAAGLTERAACQSIGRLLTALHDAAQQLGYAEDAEVAKLYRIYEGEWWQRWCCWWWRTWC
jgi:hypothetical protein